MNMNYYNLHRFVLLLFSHVVLYLTVVVCGTEEPSSTAEPWQSQDKSDITVSSTAQPWQSQNKSDVTSSSTSAPWQSQDKSDVTGSVCLPETCRNGQCYTVAQQAHCYCPILFQGSHCECVDLEHVSYVVIGSIVIFQWPDPPRLQGYSFVYYQLDTADSFMYKTDIHMKDNDRAALVGNLNAGYTTYRICIEDSLLADRVLNQQSSEYLTNCLTLSTKPDYHSLAGWCIAAMLVCVAVLIVYLQKDKFSLLYFSKPAILMYDYEQEKASETSLTPQSQATPLPNDIPAGRMVRKAAIWKNIGFMDKA